MVLRGLLEQWRAMLAHKTAAIVQKHLRRVLFEKLAELGLGYVGAQRCGVLTLTMIDGVEQLETYFGQYLPQIFVSTLTPPAIFLFVAWLDMPVAAVLLGFAVLALVAPMAWFKLDWRNAKRRQEDYAAFADDLLDSLQGLATLKAFGRSRQRATILSERAHHLFRSTTTVLGTSTLSRGITYTSIACGAVATLALGAYRVESGTVTLSALLVILMVGVEIFRPLRDLRSVLHDGMVGLSAVQSLYQVFDAKAPLADVPARSLPSLAPRINFESVEFSYPGSRRETLKSSSFQVEPGERVGIVGPSGIGKSTLVRLLLRFYDPDHGVIRIGGEDFRELPFEEIRARIAVVQQDACLFYGTLAENIRLGRPEASDEEAWAAAQVTNIDGFIAGLPQGDDSQIGEKGIKLSGGQRQRVTIARVVLRDAPILILDEALSAVDAENEATIQAALDRLMAERTTLILAHRLSSLVDCDRILVLDQGKRRGRHAYGDDGLRRRLCRACGRTGPRSISSLAQMDLAPLQREADEPQASAAEPTPRYASEGVVAAEGLGWARLVGILFGLITPWKARMTATFLFGVLRVLAFIVVGTLSALIVLDLKNGQNFRPLLPWLFVALLVPALVLATLAWANVWLALALLPFLLAVGLSPWLMRGRVDRLGSEPARQPESWRRTRSIRRRGWAKSSPIGRSSATRRKLMV